MHNFNYIETRLQTAFVFQKILLRRSKNAALLGSGDAFCAAYGGIRSACFHLGKHQKAAVCRYDIHLTETRLIILPQNAETVLLQILRRTSFSCRARFADIQTKPLPFRKLRR